MYMTYLEACSEPEGDDGVFIELGPDVQHGHDQWDHE